MWIVLCWGLWSIWTCVLCIAIDLDLISFFYMLIYSYASTIFKICFIFSISCFFVKNQVFLIVLIDICVFDSVSLILLSIFMPILGCFQYCNSSRIWSQGLWCLQKFLYCTGLFWLSWVFCFSIWSWILFFWGLWRILLGFSWALHWICRLILVRLPFLLC